MTNCQRQPAPDVRGVITYVIACSGPKLGYAAPARQLYTGSNFRHTLRAAEAMAAADTAHGKPARVLILSALYGLVELDEVLDPYDMRMGATGSVNVNQLAAQALTLGIDHGAEVYTLLGKHYLAPLEAALRVLDVWPLSAYEGTEAIGEQRHVNTVQREAAKPKRQPAEHGLRVWIGADVAGFDWGEPILVSYGRLREVQQLPKALAPWVLDSRGFNEIREHGTWTIDQDQYIADCRRYRDEIGRLEWVAPQDWPASAGLLARTGLTEAEHQQHTIASVVAMRAAAPDLDVIAVVTAETPEGYARCVDMYQAAGIDLRAETLPVGVGALVGRAPRETAQIIQLLHDAGVRRIHGFGAKGPALKLVGHLLESIDSAGWSDHARREIGRCPHNVVTWEANCPIRAREWADEQRALAAQAPAGGALLDLDVWAAAVEEEYGQLTLPFDVRSAA